MQHETMEADVSIPIRMSTALRLGLAGLVRLLNERQDLSLSQLPSTADGPSAHVGHGRVASGPSGPL